MTGASAGDTALIASRLRSSTARRVLLPVLILWATVVATGLLVVDVFALDESPTTNAFASARIPWINDVTAVLSDTRVLITTCLLVVTILWWWSRQWWFAMVPAVALGLQALVFLASSLAVGRARPEGLNMDQPAPTSSFPSGHAGAASSVYLAVALCATRISHTGLRVAIHVACVSMPIAVALARVYRGMHHPTDVIVGLIVGATCAVIAWRWAEPREGTARS